MGSVWLKEEDVLEDTVEEWYSHPFQRAQMMGEARGGGEEQDYHKMTPTFDILTSPFSITNKLISFDVSNNILAR